jgi:hypothetical protein
MSTFKERMQAANNQHTAEYARLFDGRPEVSFLLKTELSVRLAAVYGYRYLKTRGSGVARVRVFVPDTHPAARWDSVPYGTPFEAVLRHPMFSGPTARNLHNQVALTRAEHRNGPAAITVYVLFSLLGLCLIASLVATGQPVLLVPILLIAAVLGFSAWWTKVGRRRCAELTAQADDLTRRYPPYGTPPFG